MEASHRRSQSPLFVRQDSSASDRDSAPPRRSPPRLELPPLRVSRYAGDGLDFRRPAQNTSSNPSFIDLTDDDDSMPSTYATPQPEAVAPPTRPQRLPRFSREIIDLSADTSPPEPTHANLPRREQEDYAHQQNPPAAPSSPDVQFLLARPRSPHSRIQDRQPTPYQQNQFPPHPILDLTIDNDDDVVHVRTAERPAINLHRPHLGHMGHDGGPDHGFGIARIAEMLSRIPGDAARGTAGNARHGGNWFQHVFQFGGPRNNAWAEDDDDPAILHFQPRQGARQANVPGPMDYTTIGFGLAIEQEPPPRPPTPKYSPPPDPGPGFTRSPEEDDVLMCPNCKDELGLGRTDEKKQVWIVKACGHVSAILIAIYQPRNLSDIQQVYCGECMINRRTKRKGKDKVGDAPVLPPPFNVCQAPDCAKPLHKNHIMQIFL